MFSFLIFCFHHVVAIGLAWLALSLTVALFFGKVASRGGGA